MFCKCNTIFIFNVVKMYDLGGFLGLWPVSKKITSLFWDSYKLIPLLIVLKMKIFGE